MGKAQDGSFSASPPARLHRLDGLSNLEQARVHLLGLANDAGPAAAEAMLAEALVQLERIGPAVSGEVWEGYLAVEQAAHRAEVRRP